jgi:hypothetical protein
MTENNELIEFQMLAENFDIVDQNFKFKVGVVVRRRDRRCAREPPVVNKIKLAILFEVVGKSAGIISGATYDHDFKSFPLNCVAETISVNVKKSVGDFF